MVLLIPTVSQSQVHHPCLDLRQILCCCYPSDCPSPVEISRTDCFSLSDRLRLDLAGGVLKFLINDLTEEVYQERQFYELVQIGKLAVF